VAAFTSPISGSFQVLIIWLWAAIIVASEWQLKGRLSLPGRSPIFQDFRKRR
jgi:hypothetical protein